MLLSLHSSACLFSQTEPPAVSDEDAERVPGVPGQCGERPGPVHPAPGEGTHRVPRRLALDEGRLGETPEPRLQGPTHQVQGGQ